MAPSASSAAATASTIAAVVSLRAWWTGAVAARRWMITALMLVRGQAAQLQVIEGGERVVQHLRGRLGGVDHADPLGLGERELLVGGGDGREELLALAFEPVGLEPALPATRASGCGRDAQQQRAVGLQAAGGEQVDGAHLLDPQSAPCALVGERGVDEAVEQDKDAVCQQRLQQLLDELGAGGGVEQRLGARAHVERGVLDELADLLGDLDAARLAQQPHGRAARGELAAELLRERGLACAVEPLDRDQRAAGHAATVHAGAASWEAGGWSPGPTGQGGCRRGPMTSAQARNPG